ncbi:hypothetical protein DQG23_39720 [Paenibacillus contaminans]|uniref:Copper amine oxidase-like N-terminal domain-containing protein n=1 Tax=Paenibacillus contaminans TaxID=450362 RepID=A0A329LQ18_9BACL|nr:hypothetical protein DQG23_39720 [Paenibacillus contaminans]
MCSTSQPAAAAPFDNGGKRLSLADAMQEGLKASPALKEARTELTKKRTEYQQAQHAVKSQEAKDRSLFAKPHSLSKDLEISLKEPEAKKQLIEAEQSLAAQERKVKHEIETVFLSAVQASLAETGASGKLAEAERLAKEARTKLTYSELAKQESEEAEQKLEKSQSDLKVAGLAAKKARLALGDKIGQNFDKPVSFDFQPYYGSLHQDRLWGFIYAAEKSSLELFKAAETRKLADFRIEITRKLYISKFGNGPTKAVESMFNIQDLDHEAFMAVYENMLTQIKEEWEGFIWLPLPIPKSLIQGEFDGLRYFDDQKYSLPVSMLEMNKAVNQEKEARKSVTASVKQSYFDAKAAEEAYVQALKKRDKSAGEQAAAERNYRFGLLAKDGLEQAITAREQADNGVLSSQFGYLSALSKLNFDTGGALEADYRPGELPYADVDDGLEAIGGAPKQAKGLTGVWTMDQPVPTMTGQFSLKLDKAADKELKADSYAVYAPGGLQIGNTVKLKEPVRHLSFVFGSMDTLLVKLFRDGALAAEARLEGYGSSGVMKVTRIEEDGKSSAGSSSPEPSSGNSEIPAGTLIIGTYMIHRDALTPENVVAAQKTIDTSGQGILYKSEFAGGAWINIENATDLDAISRPSARTVVSAEKVADMKLLLQILKPGEVSAAMPAEELRGQKASIAKELKKNIEEQASAQENGSLQELSGLTERAAELTAQDRLLEALLAGDSKAAAAQLAAIGGASGAGGAAGGGEASGAGGTAGEGEASGAGGAAGEGGASGAGGAASGGEATQEELAASAGELQDQLTTLLAGGGDAQTVDVIVGKLLDAKLKLSAAENGFAETAAALKDAKTMLDAAFDAAQEQSETERAKLYADSSAALEQQIRLVAKEEQAAAREIAEELAEVLQEAGAASSPLLDEWLQRSAEELQQAEKRKYTAEELRQLEEYAELIREASAGEVTPLAVESIVSSDLDFKFDVPPVQIYGNTYIQIRPLLEAFGASVDWDQESATVTVTKDDTTIVCQVGGSIAFVDGEPYELLPSAVLVLGRAMIPLRFAVEALGLTVDWNEAAGTIKVSAN